MSPRNTVAATVNMMEKTSSHRMLSQRILSPLIDGVKKDLEAKHYAFEVDELPDFFTVFPALSGGKVAETAVEPYPQDPRVHLKDDIALYLHSSGSTGFPKPIPLTRKIILEWCQRRA